MTAKKNAKIAADLITEKARAALANCNSLRSMHDTSKKLITEHQLGLDFDPKRNNSFEMPTGLLICNMAESIRTALDADAVQGFASAYLAGDYVEPMGVVAEGGKLRVVAGFARYAGLMMAIASGADIKRVWVTQVVGGRAKELVRQLVSNQQVQASPLELAAAYRELIEVHGFSVGDLATAIHRKETHIRKMLSLDSVAPEVKEMVAKGQASVTAVLTAEKHCKATGQDTVVHMRDQLTKAQRNGSAKITSKSVGAPAALYGRKDLDVAAPVLVQLADQLEKAIPFMAAAPGSVKVELTLDGSAMNLQDLTQALANLRAAFLTAQAGSALIADVG